jgi:hypothetical protein
MTRKEHVLDKNIKVIYNKLENIKLNNQGYIDLSESSINEANDIVNICNIFRDPRYETFRVFYMKDNKIVGQEAITSKIPDAVIVFNNKEGNPIRTYEKMNNRMQRLNADGYYLAHNHPSESAKASSKDMEITRNFAANVEGFLGHIIVSSTNKYSFIEEDEDGLILVPEEKCLEDSTINKMNEKLREKDFYNIKISSRDEMVALFMKMQNEKEYSTAILTDAKNNIRMVLDIPNNMMNQDLENLNGFFKNIARNIGANRVFIGTHDQKTYFKIIEHQRFGTFKDMVYIDNYNKIITEKITKSPDLFDKEKIKKSHLNRDAR